MTERIVLLGGPADGREHDIGDECFEHFKVAVLPNATAALVSDDDVTVGTVTALTALYRVALDPSTRKRSRDDQGRLRYEYEGTS